MINQPNKKGLYDEAFALLKSIRGLLSAARAKHEMAMAARERKAA